MIKLHEDCVELYIAPDDISVRVYLNKVDMEYFFKGRDTQKDLDVLNNIIHQAYKKGMSDGYDECENDLNTVYPIGVGE